MFGPDAQGNPMRVGASLSQNPMIRKQSTISEPALLAARKSMLLEYSIESDAMA
jgi:hypothetical protein